MNHFVWLTGIGYSVSVLDRRTDRPLPALLGAIRSQLLQTGTKGNATRPSLAGNTIFNTFLVCDTTFILHGNAS